MDDLYTNAWNDPTEPTSPAKPSKNDSWPLPRAAIAEEDADLSVPSWSTGAGWDEPTDAPGISWSQADADAGWNASTYDEIHIAETSIPTEHPSSSSSSETGDGPAVPSILQSPEVPRFPEAVTPPSSPPVSASALQAAEPQFTTPIPNSPDVFGTFESAFSPDEGPHTDVQKTLGSDAWSSPWINREESVDSKEEVVDEWEAAKQRKAQQDRKVPPEVLNAILENCADFSAEVWPPSSDAALSESGAWRNDRRSGMDGVEGLNSLFKDFLPAPTLQPPVQFGKTDIAKKMASSVRLTKNLPLTKGSPMSHYLAARGSTAWETSVKERKELTDDVVPHGWRIVDNQSSTVPSTDASKDKKPAGRLFSFWSRRESSTHARSPSQTEETESMRSTQTESVSSPPGDMTGTSRRSRDSLSSVRASVEKTSSPVSSLPLPATLPTSLIAASSTTSPSPSVPIAGSSQITSYSDAPDPQIETSHGSNPAPVAPSAVSRFFNRFSRQSAAGVSTRSPRSSLALSSDDIEFLADVVPSATDDMDDEFEVSSRSLAIKAQPLPPILPPPPSAPPLARQLKIETGFTHGDRSAVSAAGGVRPGPTIQLQNFGSSSVVSQRPSSSRSGSIPIQPNPQPLNSSAPVLSPTSRSNRSASPFSSASADKPSQPFYLPSPPSSRAQTPVASVPMAQATLVGTAMDLSRPSSVSATRSHSIPPPIVTQASSRGRPRDTTSSPTRSDSPGSPSSVKPLAELYPLAFRNSTPPKPTTTTTPSSSFAPPPSLRQSPLPPLLAPPPGSRVPSAQASNAVVHLFDDNDFADFHVSSAAPTSSLPAPSSAFDPNNLFSPLSANSHVSSKLLQSSSPSSALQSSSSAWQKSTPALSPSAFDDDDFSDFHSFNPSSSMQSFNTPSFSDSLSSENAFLTVQTSFGFDSSDVPSPTLPSPSPPRPISKSSRRPSGPPPKLQLSGVEPQMRKKLNNAEHQHTLSLMERAAARPGRWPAPPSPLPQALAFPMPILGPGGSKPVDLLGDDSAEVQDDGVSASFSSPALMSPTRKGSAAGLGAGTVLLSSAPVSQSQSMQDFDPFGSVRGSVRGTAKPPVGGILAPVMRPAASTGSNSSVQKSGLSAQDLSFFEGL